jgi:hypothetical protein
MATAGLAKAKEQEYFWQLGCTRYLIKSYIY